MFDAGFQKEYNEKFKETQRKIEDSLEKRDEIIRAFGQLVEKKPSGFNNELPCEKDIISLALLHDLTYSNVQIGEFLKVGITLLANFIPTIGEYKSQLLTTIMGRATRLGSFKGVRPEDVPEFMELCNLLDELDDFERRLLSNPIFKKAFDLTK